MTDKPKDRPTYRKLRPRQKKFVMELAHGADAIQAAKTVYPAATNAKDRIQKSLANPRIQNALVEVLDHMYPDLKKNMSEVLIGLLNDSESKQIQLKALEMLVKVYGFAAPAKSQSLHAHVNVEKYKLPGGDA